jgi:Holliday junction resolvase RusA-like endonuclease
MIEFTVLIEPVAKARPRFSRLGFAYTDKKTREYESAFALAASRYRPKAPLQGPLAVNLHFTLARPKSTRRLFPCVRPDVDNYAKAVLDALSAFWGDDGQIVELFAVKQYGVPVGVHVQIDEVANA